MEKDNKTINEQESSSKEETTTLNDLEKSADLSDEKKEDESLDSVIKEEVEISGAIEQEKPEYKEDVLTLGFFDRMTDFLNSKNSIKIDENGEAKKAEMSKGVKSFYEWADAAVFSLVLIAFIFAFIARQVQVFGPSMEPNLYTGQRLVMTSLFYTPKRGDIVIVNRHTDDPLIKRIIALGGDKLVIDEKNKQILVNDEVLEEPYINGETKKLAFPDEGITVPEGQVIVMGDNRMNSHDSRQIGPVAEEDIMGKAVFRFYPLKDFGGLK